MYMWTPDKNDSIDNLLLAIYYFHPDTITKEMKIIFLSMQNNVKIELSGLL